ncbi:hypothetical protein M0R72_07320 [Candidatus Pacearchaeota archaeon]|jgi:hypothetical protein|nr:hypothetical protein [Candidatus Pacearchaeota archaeon]
MSASNSLENSILLLLFNNTAFANIGDASGLQPSATAGSFYVSLHTADPGEAGNQTSSECDYANYARVAVARTSGGWTVSTNSVTNTATISFPKAAVGATPDVATHFGVGTADSGAGVLLFSGELTDSLTISQNITPQIPASNLTITND